MRGELSGDRGMMAELPKLKRLSRYRIQFPDRSRSSVRRSALPISVLGIAVHVVRSVVRPGDHAGIAHAHVLTTEGLEALLRRGFGGHPASYGGLGLSCEARRAKQDGGEDGIRTHEKLLTSTPLAGERLRPLGHLSVAPLDKEKRRHNQQARVIIWKNKSGRSCRLPRCGGSAAIPWPSTVRRSPDSAGNKRLRRG